MTRLKEGSTSISNTRILYQLTPLIANMPLTTNQRVNIFKSKYELVHEWQCVFHKVYNIIALI